MPRRRAGRAAPEQGGDGTADNGTERVHGGYLGVLGNACAGIFLEGKPRSTVGWGLPGPIDLMPGFRRSGHSLGLYSPNDAEGKFSEVSMQDAAYAPLAGHPMVGLRLLGSSWSTT